MKNRRLLGSVLAAAMIFPYSPMAHADGLLKNFSFSGQLDTLGVDANNVSDFQTGKYDRVNNVQARLILNMAWDLADDVHSKVTLRKNDGFWGANASVSQTLPSNSQPLISGGGNGVADNIFVDQAYVKVDKAIGDVDTTVGRQFYGSQGDMIYFGPYDMIYGMPASAIDAARLDWSNDMLGVTALAGQGDVFAHADSKLTFPNAHNVDMQGAAVTFKGIQNLSARLDAWNVNWHALGATQYFYFLQAKLKYVMGPFYLAGLYAQDLGQDRITGQNLNGWAYTLKGGANLDAGAASLKPWIGLAMGSGGNSGNHNDTFFAPNPSYMGGSVYTMFDSLALAGVGTPLPTSFATNSLGDRAIWSAGLKATPQALSQLTASVSYWNYNFQQAETAPASTTGKGNTHIGSELDLDLTWKHSDTISYKVGWGQFWAGGYIANLNGGPTNPAQLLYADMQVKF